MSRSYPLHGKRIDGTQMREPLKVPVKRADFADSVLAHQRHGVDVVHDAAREVGISRRLNDQKLTRREPLDLIEAVEGAVEGRDTQHFVVEHYCGMHRVAHTGDKARGFRE